mgnify:CR=1 FL=1
MAVAQEEWEVDAKNNRILVTEDNVADVVSMMTGIPVNRIAQTESNKLAQLPELIEGKVIGQKEAVLKAALFKPHAALVDLHLGDENGTDVAHALRESFPNITIVYMTGYSSLLPTITSNSTDTVLKKPFEIDVAISALMKGQK